jgi:hypothetical protein
VLDDQINKEILQFLDTNIPTTASEFALYFATVEKFIYVELEHLEQEEQEVLTPLNEVLSIEEKSTLEDDILFAKKYGPTHPHPGYVPPPLLFLFLLFHSPSPFILPILSFSSPFIPLSFHSPLLSFPPNTHYAKCLCFGCVLILSSLPLFQSSFQTISRQQHCAPIGWFG